MPSKEFLWFQEHYDELTKKYPGKVVAIVDDQLVGVGDTILEVGRQAFKITAKDPFFGKVRGKRALIL